MLIDKKSEIVKREKDFINYSDTPKDKYSEDSDDNETLTNMEMSPNPVRRRETQYNMDSKVCSLWDIWCSNACA